MKLLLLVALVPFVAAHTTGSENEIDAKLSDIPVYMATRAVNDYFNGNNTNGLLHVPTNIFSATSQVTQGISYNYLIRYTNGQNFEDCDINVWARSWLPAPDNYVTTVLNCTAESLIGGDDHDYVPHGTTSTSLIGGDDHDYLPHGTTDEPLIGGDDHDYLPHGTTDEPLFGGDDHDYLPHGTTDEPLIGGDDHDYLPHGRTTQIPSARAGLLGGEGTASLEDPDVKAALAVFTNTVNAESNSMYRVIPVPVSGTVTKQVVNGIIYQFKNVKFAHTTCTNTNDDKIDDKNCPLVDESVIPSISMCGKVTWTRGDNNQGVYKFPAKITAC